MSHTSKHIAELQQNVGLFKSSPGGTDVVTFIVAASQRIRGMGEGDPPPASINACQRALVAKLNTYYEWIRAIPPSQQQQRFGNRSFRVWLDRLREHAEADVAEIVASCSGASKAVPEMSEYLIASFGDYSRIDYGTGHELAFAAFLCCLVKQGLVDTSHFPGLVLYVFPAYLNVTRELQTVYWLEPAGSKGVWGLDDYSFLPFLWGASQLVDHPTLSPGSILDQSILEEKKGTLLYLDAVLFIRTMKRGLFAEYAPLLNDISSVPTWDKVNQGLIRMYDKEVLSKFPVVQHFLFGSILPFKQS